MNNYKDSVQTIEEAQQKWPKKDIGKAKDLTNQRFGKLVCLYRTENKKNIVRWVCQCDCGNIKSINASELTRTKKAQRSCGCSAQERSKNFGKITAKDITNKRFGKLIALNKIDTNKYGYAIWQCKCDCGNLCKVATRELLSGDTKSCGCLEHEKHSYPEIQIQTILQNMQIDFQQEYKFDDLLDKFQLRFDFAIFKNNQLKGLIEYQGEQHYNVNNKFYNSDIVRHDQMKKDYCITHQIPLFEIKYTEIKLLEEKIQEIIKRLGC